MNKSPRTKKDLNDEQLVFILSHQDAARSVKFMGMIEGLYKSCRKKAQEGFEKNKDTAAYWSGRSDALELLMENCKDSLTLNLANYDEK